MNRGVVCVRFSESFGINENLIYRWKSVAKVSSKQVDSSVVKELKQLRGELVEVRQEPP